MIGHKPECPANWGVGEMPEGPCTFCEMLSACEQRVWKDPLLVVSRRAGWNDALVMAREVMEATHRPVAVIECPCGWGKDCPECGSESNRIVGYVCDACCNSFGDHAYCDDLHHEDTPLHHQNGEQWSGPHCPTMAAIDALRRESDV